MFLNHLNWRDFVKKGQFAESHFKERSFYFFILFEEQDGKKSLSVAIVDESYAFDLMEKHVKILSWKLNFKVNIFFFFLHYIILITKVKLFEKTTGRYLIILLKNAF